MATLPQNLVYGRSRVRIPCNV